MVEKTMFWWELKIAECTRKILNVSFHFSDKSFKTCQVVNNEKIKLSILKWDNMLEFPMFLIRYWTTFFHLITGGRDLLMSPSVVGTKPKKYTILLLLSLFLEFWISCLSIYCIFLLDWLEILILHFGRLAWLVRFLGHQIPKTGSIWTRKPSSMSWLAK